MQIRPQLVVALLPLLLSSVASSCQGGNATAPVAVRPKFEAERAWKHLEAQVALGPRPSGSEANSKLRDYLVEELGKYGLKPVREPFTASDAPGGPIAMENIYADFEGRPVTKDQPAPMITLGAHFDTKRMSFPFLGANDGASGVGALLELARVISSGEPGAVTYRFLFLDGEEAVRDFWEDPDNCYGSRHHVSELTKKFGALKRVKAFILLDMVGDADLMLERDSNSSRELLDDFMQTAKRIGDGAIFSDHWHPIRDDHEQFKRFGVPALDLIDLHYGAQNNEYWHTAQDTIEHCSKESLARTGRLVLETLPKLEARATR
jgi:Zn-dependent M28 family amino/carboxypeptidase